jgi:hypothetical protein
VREIGLMEFMRLDAGAVLAKAHVNGNPKSIRLIIGNPLIMQSMARLVPDAVSYAPVTVLKASQRRTSRSRDDLYSISLLLSAWLLHSVRQGTWDRLIASLSTDL